MKPPYHGLSFTLFHRRIFFGFRKGYVINSRFGDLTFFWGHERADQPGMSMLDMLNNEGRPPLDKATKKHIGAPPAPGPAERLFWPHSPWSTKQEMAAGKAASAMHRRRRKKLKNN